MKSERIFDFLVLNICKFGILETYDGARVFSWIKFTRNSINLTWKIFKAFLWWSEGFLFAHNFKKLK